MWRKLWQTATRGYYKVTASSLRLPQTFTFRYIVVMIYVGFRFGNWTSITSTHFNTFHNSSFCCLEFCILLRRVSASFTFRPVVHFQSPDRNDENFCALILIAVTKQISKPWRIMCDHTHQQLVQWILSVFSSVSANKTGSSKLFTSFWNPQTSDESFGNYSAGDQLYCYSATFH